MTLHTQTLSGSCVCISTAIYWIILSHCLCPSQLSLSPFGTDWPHSSPFNPEGFLPRVCLSLSHACTVVSVHCPQLSRCGVGHCPICVHERVFIEGISSPLPSPLNACCLCFLPQIPRTPLTRPRSLTWTKCGVHWHNSQLTLQRLHGVDRSVQTVLELMGMYHDCTLYTSNYVRKLTWFISCYV